MKYFKIKDSAGNLQIVRADSAIEAVKQAAIKTRDKQKTVIGVKDSVEYSYYNGKFYADDKQIDDKRILDEVKKGTRL